MSGISLRNNKDQQRYELLEGDSVMCIADYRVDGDAVAFFHTEVSAGQEGKGWASKLAKFALDDVVAGDKKIVPQCSFIAAYVKRHPEYESALKSA